MPRNQHIHYEHHRREVTLTRQRFKLALMLLFLGLFVAVGLQFYASHAASSTPDIVSGISSSKCMDDTGNSTTNGNKVQIWNCLGDLAQEWVKDGDEVKINGKCLDVLSAGTTNGTLIDLYACNGGENQDWTYTNNQMISEQSSKCLDDPHSNTANGTQLDLYTCNGTDAQIWKVSSFIQATPAPVPTPVATTVPTPVPTTAPTRTPTPVPTAASIVAPMRKPTPTPVPASVPLSVRSTGGDSGAASGTSGSGAGSSSNGGSGLPVKGTGSSSSGAGNSTPKSASSDSTSSSATSTDPSGFSALASGSNAVIDLSWLASTDDSGIADYQLERSIDQINWSVVSSTITSTSYDDSSVDFGVHYYYRIEAIDSAGATSNYVYADATTVAFIGNTEPGGSTSSYTSDDDVATVTLPIGALDNSADCSVTEGASQSFNPLPKKIVVGPYSLVCKNQQGNLIASFNGSLNWKISIKSKLKGLNDPEVYSLDANSKLDVVGNAEYTATAASFVFTAASADPVLVLASAAPSFPWSLIFTILLLTGIVGGVLVLILRQKQKVNYDEYIRTKYYNL
jgi:hypothetical protein